MYDELCQQAESALRNGEKLLWSGKPDPKRLLSKSLSDLGLGVLLAIFLMFWYGVFVHLWLEGNYFVPIIFGGFALPFVGIMLLLVSAPFFAGKRAMGTAYFITDQRVLVIKPGLPLPALFGGVTSFELRDLMLIKRRDLADGKGDISFYSPKRDEKRLRGHEGFYGIPDARDVETNLLNAQKACTSG